MIFRLLYDMCYIVFYINLNLLQISLRYIVCMMYNESFVGKNVIVLVLYIYVLVQCYVLNYFYMYNLIYFFFIIYRILIMEIVI